MKTRRRFTVEFKAKVALEAELATKLSLTLDFRHRSPDEVYAMAEMAEKLAA